MNKYIKHGAIIGGIWGLIADFYFLTIGKTGLISDWIGLPLGLATIVGFVWYNAFIGSILIGAFIGAIIGYLINKFKKQ